MTFHEQRYRTGDFLGTIKLDLYDQYGREYNELRFETRRAGSLEPIVSGRRIPLTREELVALRDLLNRVLDKPEA